MASFSIDGDFVDYLASDETKGTMPWAAEEDNIAIEATDTSGAKNSTTWP